LTDLLLEAERLRGDVRDLPVEVGVGVPRPRRRRAQQDDGQQQRRARRHCRPELENPRPGLKRSRAWSGQRKVEAAEKKPADPGLVSSTLERTNWPGFFSLFCSFEAQPNFTGWTAQLTMPRGPASVRTRIGLGRDNHISYAMHNKKTCPVLTRDDIQLITCPSFLWEKLW
jgi:hypothetical protein